MSEASLLPSRVRRGLKRAVVYFGLAMAICVFIMLALGVWGWYVYGSCYAGPAILRGDIFLIDSNNKFFGKIPAKKSSLAWFEITNLRSCPVTVLGATTNCGCVYAEKLPVTLAASERTTIRFLMTPRPTDMGKSFSQRVLLLVDSPGPPVVLTVAAQVQDHDDSG